MDTSLHQKKASLLTRQRVKRAAVRILCLTVIMSILLSGTAFAAVRTLKQGQSGDDVRMLQTRLTELGYYTGQADGTFDAETRTAVKLFQKANDMSSDGSLNSSEQKVLYSTSCLTLTQYNAIKPLSKGDSGAEVATVQQQLTRYGFYAGSISGKFDNATRSAVKAFQTANGLKDSGKATSETRALLNSGKVITASEYDKVRPLKSGNSGAAVQLLQEQLKKLGYYTDSVDGKYNSAVKNAVKNFQAANNIKSTGTADVNTRKLINSGVCVPAVDYYKVCALKYGNNSAAVVVLQQRLTELQYYDGTLDGKYDTEVKNSVKSFQTANNLKATGTADVNTRKLMNSAACVTGATYNLVCPLKSGNSGVAVKVLQNQLRTLGFYDGAIDGKYDSAVKSAVKNFQTANSLKTSGTADANTRKLMSSGNCVNAEAYDRVRPLKSGNKGAAVVLLQNQLKTLGFYDGAIDGKYDSAVKTAVKNFQTANSLKASGTADVNTRSLLNSGKGVNAVEYDKVRPLKSGNKGNAVVQLQNQLAALGYFVDTIDGKYDSGTKNAVKVFQAANGLKANGTADTNTRILLNSGKCVNREAYDTNRTLKKGEVGSTVRALQNRLIVLGYYEGRADGSYQSSTQKAVKLFQTAHGLDDTGVADVKMRALLFSANAVHYMDYEKVRPIKYGEKSEAVLMVQKQLYQLGYFTETPNARYRSDTKEAVQMFQAVHGLKKNGSYITVEMRTLLNSGNCISAANYYGSVPLEKGDKGEAVKHLQKRLTELGYYTDEITGTYGSVTAKAVAYFQTANSLSATGDADTNTRAVMNSAKAITKTQYENSLGGSNDPNRIAKIERLITIAKSKLGCKYVHNTSGPNTFDCSGFTRYVFGQVGIDLSGASEKQGYLDKYGEPYLKKLTSYEQLQRGDLLVFDTDKDDDDLSDHLGIYLGDGTFIHSSSARAEVVISDLYRYGNFSWAFRLI